MLALILSFFFALTPASAHSKVLNDSTKQQHDSTDVRRVTIDKIFIIGNKKTRDKIILRELDVAAGEVYAANDLQDILKADKNKIFNLQLFNSVEISTLNLSPHLVDIVIKVSERWYIFPSPIFDIVDRNFNDWWQNQDHDFSRTNYGVKIYQNNFRGRNETLRLILQFGYTKQFGLAYRVPYIDRAQKHGLSFGFNYSENKNVPYITEDHKRLFFDSEELLQLKRNFFVGYRFRNNFYTRHSANLVFNSNSISDTLVALNPNFYNNAETTQRYFELSYKFERDKRDIVSYPLHGNELEIEATKFGLGIFNDVDKFDINIQYTQYSDLNRHFYLANYSSLYFSGPAKQPYSNLNGLGYKTDFIRGYELYVVEGQNYYLNRTTLKKRLFAIRERLGFMPLEQFRDFPLAVYLKTYFDMGYVDNLDLYEEEAQNTRLSNSYLAGTGFGLDFVSAYDTVIRLEYSFTREQTSGFFFHLKKEF